MSELHLRPLLFGGDINVYSMARAFHEAYGLHSTVYAKFASGPCCDSKIADLRAVGEKNEDPDTFFQNVTAFANAHPEDTVLLIGCGDSYVKLAARFMGQYPDNVVAPYIPLELMEQLMNKERFYELCDELGIPHPLTFVYEKDMGADFTLPFDFPCVAKPSDGVAYWEHPFPGNDKVFHAGDRAALQDYLDKAYAAGYPGTMVIQEFIPGDDTAMRVLTCYSDRNAQVKLMCLGHVLLEEHSPHGLGNHAVILNEPVDPALAEPLKQLLEKVQFTGFSNFDLKYDVRDGKYKAFEINVRQGRSNYYVTGAGYNLAKLVTEDRILERELPVTMADKPFFWHVVPLSVTKEFIAGEEYQKRMEELRRAGLSANPMENPADSGFKRKLRLKRLAKLYKQQFPQYMKKEV
ncbi:MAG: ATP-grasp domain-containing protein [Oscillospiraceae bacterium]|nr:ATP-grasp domain-containing protein [Oscillospiraceae bacterium]